MLAYPKLKAAYSEVQLVLSLPSLFASVSFGCWIPVILRISTSYQSKVRKSRSCTPVLKLLGRLDPVPTIQVIRMGIHFTLRRRVKMHITTMGDARSLRSGHCRARCEHCTPRAHHHGPRDGTWRFCLLALLCNTVSADAKYSRPWPACRTESSGPGSSRSKITWR